MTNLIIDNSLQRVADPQTPYFVGDVYVLLKRVKNITLAEDVT